ncbi:hypothetical protein TorRG33x02_136920 [Trema orientale]|uniref:Pollen Ole e 1 allergen and extensin family protein n=1 Tax=Trema orientale TaxID=63057 RepID=A0A2P5EXY6_TREOI|nr:hypothetical protein TorRG33x02_136920 [Trema orientale]
MAYQTPVLLLIATLLVSMMSTFAHCMRILPNHKLPANAPSPSPSPSNNEPLVRVRIPGMLQCSLPPAIPPKFPPLVAGVNVGLSCDGGVTIIGNAVTNTSGFFEIVLDSASSVLFSASKSDACRVIPRLPIALCRVWLPKGVLENPVGAVLSITDKLFGNNDNVVSAGNDHTLHAMHGDHLSYTRKSPYDKYNHVVYP